MDAALAHAATWLRIETVDHRTGELQLDAVIHPIERPQTWIDPATQQPHSWTERVLVVRATAYQAGMRQRREQALDHLKLAMSKANELGVPELIVEVGQTYTQALLGAGKVEEAVAVSGELSNWGQLDWRAAWAQACAYRALGQVASWERYRQKARELAGDRVLPADASVVVY